MPASDADLDAEPEVLMCPITRAMFRDPVIAVESGHTYERSAILSHFERNGAKDPLTNRALSSTKVMTNWAVRQFAQDWLDRHPGVTPECSGHGVRCALNCRSCGQKLRDRSTGKG